MIQKISKKKMTGLQPCDKNTETSSTHKTQMR